MDRTETINYFAQRFGLNLNQNPPIEIHKINRRIMAECLADLGFKTGAEIGVAAGDHSDLLLQVIPDLTMYCIDPWMHIDGFASWRKSTLQNWKAEAISKLSKHKKCTIIQKMSAEAAASFEDASLDFVYIDAAHDFKHIAIDICVWITKVKPGGILFGHDYTRIPFGGFPCHVKDVVDAYAVSHNIDTWFVLGLPGKIDGMYREGELSWMFVI